MPRILFVSGFHPSTRARDLAYEFERYGPLVRCDVPAPRNPRANSNPYAFVEFRSQRDAEDAYYDMHGRMFEGSRLSIQWAKNPPSSVWRYERRSPPPSRRDRDRSRSPRRRSDRDRDYDRDRGYDRDRDRGDRDRDRDREREPRADRDDRDKDRGDERRRRSSRSPERRRSASPERRKDDRARTPPPLEEDVKKDEDRERERERDRAQTPPRDY
ncbi:RNA-binding domain-containing protein [Trametes coccinea BRFM310]|uniref:RNA-binding domain-containing protein n=1 Tax=Trametes coccinea (strain BRFM310) TaxID=1353009 RepID=A0A1Y2IHH0_TRAC3|nr:RNA-binding domain-containing protein [Trametes coccinea BRFM310]